MPAVQAILLSHFLFTRQHKKRNATMIRVTNIYLLFLLFSLCLALNKRFEYKHSFKGPHLVQKDRTVPFWTYVGSKFTA